MMVLSLSLERRLQREMLRHIGSQALLLHYSGRMPRTCEDEATGEKLGSTRMNEPILRSAFDGREPEMVEGAGYWRLLDNSGSVVMQGNGGNA